MSAQERIGSSMPAGPGHGPGEGPAWEESGRGIRFSGGRDGADGYTVGGGRRAEALGATDAEDQLTRRAIQWWLWPSLIGLILGPSIGVLQSIQFVNPRWMEWLANVGLAYSTLRVMHTNSVVYMWLTMAFTAAALYVVPRLAKRPLVRPQLALYGAWLYLFGIVAAIVLTWWAIPGHPLFSIQVPEYAEAPIFADLFLGAGLVLITWVLTETVVKRKAKLVYVSLWYLLAAYWGTLFAFVVVNFLTPMIKGVGNVYLQGWWIHNAVGLIITPLGIGMAYYIIPKITGRPIFSHRLGMLGFWTLYAFYPGIGLHHFLQMPSPVWLNQFAVVGSVLLAIPVILVVYNHLASIRQAPQKLFDNYALRFVMMGSIYYLFTGLQGAFQANNLVNPYIHFTEWVQAHAHLALAASFTSFAMGGLVYVFPRVTGRQLVGRRAMSVAFWSLAAVFPVFFAVFTLSGLTAAAGINTLGFTVYEVIPAQTLARLFRSVSGGLLMVGWWVFAGIFWASRKHGATFVEGMDEVVPGEPVPGYPHVQEGGVANV